MATDINKITSGQNRFTRRWTSTNNVAEPLITGYFFIRFDQAANFNLGTNTEYSANWSKILESSLISFTIPGATVNRAEFQGLGGIRWSYPTTVDWDNTISMRFNEWAGAPVCKVFHTWVKMIKDYRTGLQNRGREDGTFETETGKTELTTSAWYWTSTPDAQNVDFYSFSTGMFPLKDPTDSFSYDIATVDKMEVDIDWNVDVVYQEASVKQACAALLASYRSEGSSNATVTTQGDDNVNNTSPK
jgi:hypothetical protein